jgi:hypothetical protein
VNFIRVAEAVWREGERAGGIQRVPTGNSRGNVEVLIECMARPEHESFEERRWQRSSFELDRLASCLTISSLDAMAAQRIHILRLQEL